MIDLIELAMILGLLSPFLIVGTGVVLGLTLAVSQVMLGLVLGMIKLFHPNEED